MKSYISQTAVIYEKVKINKPCIIQDFVLIGISGGDEEPSMETVIGTDSIIRSHSVIYYGNQIGKNFQAGHGILLRENNHIGDSVSIGSHSTIEHHINIGSFTRIHSNVFIPEFSYIENNVWIGPNVVFTNATYPSTPSTKANLRGPHIMPYSRIGANATILPGIQIGKNSLIGAGSVITKNVPEGAVVIGNPAKVIRMVSEISEYDFVKYLNE